MDRRLNDIERRVMSLERGISRATDRRALGKRGGSCPSRNEIQHLTVRGMPTGGFLILHVTVPTHPDGAFASASAELDWNFDKDEIKAAVIAEHPEVGTDDLIVTGGPLPNAHVQFEFTGRFAGVDIPVMMASWDTLTGGSGVGVSIHVIRDGYPRRVPQPVEEE